MLSDFQSACLSSPHSYACRMGSVCQLEMRFCFDPFNLDICYNVSAFAFTLAIGMPF